MGSRPWSENGNNRVLGQEQISSPFHLTSSQRQLEALASRSFTSGVSSPSEGPFWYRGEPVSSSDLARHFHVSSAWRFPFYNVLPFVLAAKDLPQQAVLRSLSGGLLAGFCLARLPSEPCVTCSCP